MKRVSCFIFLIISMLLLTSCASREGVRVIIVGSTSVQPYIEMLGEDYEIFYPESIVDIQGGGSSAGITSVINGTADIGMSSRSLKESEQHLWSIEIAKDGLALIIHPDNPINNLSKEQIQNIYTLKTTNWSELGGADHKIHIIAREEGSGTRSAFQEMVMDGKFITPKAIVQNSNGAVRQLVSDDKYSIGFISLGLVDSQKGQKDVKAVSIENVSPTHENVSNGNYALYRPFLFVMNSEPSGLSKHFLNFVLSAEGQKVLVEEGLISINGYQLMGDYK